MQKMHRNNKMNAKHPWIILKYDVNPNECICERCGGKQVMPEGSMHIDMMIAIMKAFMRMHKTCKEKTK